MSTITKINSVVQRAAKRLCQLDGVNWQERATGADHRRQIAYAREAQAVLDEAGYANLLAALEALMKAPGFHVNPKNPARLNARAAIAKAKTTSAS